MFQARIHGRGGQGVVSASQIMSIAAFHQGRYSQSFPSFGSERMGAPVKAYVRIDDREIQLREPVVDPDLLVVQDASLFHAIDVFAGLKPDGYVLVNTKERIEDLGISEAVSGLPDGHLVRVPATELALQHVKRPAPNTVMLGAFAAMDGPLELAAVEQAIAERFPGKVGAMNIAAARAAYELVGRRQSC